MKSVNADIGSPPSSPEEEVTILPCNFRSAGRISNDSIRHLRTMHETFARNLSHSLDLFLGSPIEVRLLAVEQLGSREFVSTLATGSYLVPFTLLPLQNRIITQFDSALLFPLLDLLLGGSGEGTDTGRELTDIDEDLIRSVLELIGIQLERTWKACQVSVLPSPSLKPALVGQFFLTEERTAVLSFEISLARTTATMRFVLPMAFCNALVRSSHPDTNRILGGDAGALLPLQERVLECDMLLSAELTDLTISVGDLITMQPASIVDLNTPVDTAVRLNIGPYSLFEVTPVRKGLRKSTQLDRSCQGDFGA